MEIKALLLLGLELDEAKKYLEDGPAEEVVQKALAKLKKRALMLDDYFSLEMNEEQNLITIPLLLGKKPIICLNSPTIYLHQSHPRTKSYVFLAV